MISKARILTVRKWIRNPITNYLFLTLNNIKCTKCKKAIEDNTFCFLCDDYNKIWHEKCFEREHIRSTIVTLVHQQHHYDRFVLVQDTNQDTIKSAEEGNLIEIDL